MAKIYKGIDETINKTVFGVRIPDNHSSIIPGYYKAHPEVRPIFNGGTGFSNSMLSIAGIINLAHLDVEFIIIDPKDIITINELLQIYTNKLVELSKQLPETSVEKIYIAKCRKTLKILNHILPTAKAKEVNTQKFVSPQSVVEMMNRNLNIWNNL